MSRYFLKGQSAIEYLMTYGWMLLVVALVGGLLFTLFQDQELESESIDGFENEDIRVEEVAVANGSVQLNLRSFSEEAVENGKLCLDNSRFNKICSDNFSLNRLGSESIGLDGFIGSNKSYTYNIGFSYESINGLEGDVKGTVDLMAKPEAGGSLSLRSVDDNISTVSPGDSVKIYGELNSSDSELDSGWLATNESGSWENKTGEYLNDSLSGEDEWVWNNFTWSNSSVSNTNVSWKLYANNSDGITKSSAERSFKVYNDVASYGSYEWYIDEDSGNLSADVGNVKIVNSGGELKKSDNLPRDYYIRFNQSSYGVTNESLPLVQGKTTVYGWIKFNDRPNDFSGFLSSNSDPTKNCPYNGFVVLFSTDGDDIGSSGYEPNRCSGGSTGLSDNDNWVDIGEWGFFALSIDNGNTDHKLAVYNRTSKLGEWQGSTNKNPDNTDEKLKVAGDQISGDQSMDISIAYLGTSGDSKLTSNQIEEIWNSTKW